MFSHEEQKAIEDKLEQLGKVKNGLLKPQELAMSITKRRIAWLKENKKDVLAKYAGLPDEEKAYRILYFDHMKINPEHSKLTKISDGKIKIESWSFCPYLEACKKLGLDTKFVCREIGESSCQKFCEMINPRIKFSRNYKNIRPYSNFCEEYFEIT